LGKSSLGMRKQRIFGFCGVPPTTTLYIIEGIGIPDGKAVRPFDHEGVPLKTGPVMIQSRPSVPEHHPRAWLADLDLAGGFPFHTFT
jgi:hypothetical protein